MSRQPGNLHKSKLAEKEKDTPSKLFFPCKPIKSTRTADEDLRRAGIVIKNGQSNLLEQATTSKSKSSIKIRSQTFEERKMSECEHIAFVDSICTPYTIPSFQNLTLSINEDKVAICDLCGALIGCPHFAVLLFLYKQSISLDDQEEIKKIPNEFQSILLLGHENQISCSRCQEVFSMTHGQMDKDISMRGRIFFANYQGNAVDIQTVQTNLQAFLYLITPEIYENMMNPTGAINFLADAILSEWPCITQRSHQQQQSGFLVHLIHRFLIIFVWFHCTTIINQSHKFLQTQETDLTRVINWCLDRISPDSLVGIVLRSISDIHKWIQEFIEKNIKPKESKYKTLMYQFLKRMKLNSYKSITVHTALPTELGSGSPFTTFASTISYEHMPLTLPQDNTSEAESEMPMIDEDGHIHLFHEDICTKCTQHRIDADKRSITADEYLETSLYMDARKSICKNNPFHSYVDDKCIRCGHVLNTTFQETLYDLRRQKIKVSYKMTFAFKPEQPKEANKNIVPFKPMTQISGNGGFLSVYISTMKSNNLMGEKREAHDEIINVLLSLSFSLVKLVPFDSEEILPKYKEAYRQGHQYHSYIAGEISQYFRKNKKLIRNYLMDSFELICMIIGQSPITPSLQTDIKQLLMDKKCYNDIAIAELNMQRTDVGGIYDFFDSKLQLNIEDEDLTKKDSTTNTSLMEEDIDYTGISNVEDDLQEITDGMGDDFTLEDEQY